MCLSELGEGLKRSENIMLDAQQGVYHAVGTDDVEYHTSAIDSCSQVKVRLQVNEFMLCLQSALNCRLGDLCTR